MRVVRVVMVLFGVAAVVLAILAVVHPRVASTGIVDLLPLPGDRAVLLRDDRDTGHPRWLEIVGRNSSRVRLDFEARAASGSAGPSTLATAGAAIVVADDHGGIGGYDVESLRELWRTNGEAGAGRLAIEIGTLDTLIAVWTEQGKPAKVVASDPLTGKERWRRTLAGPLPGPAAIHDDDVFVFEEPGLEVFDLKTGATRLQNPTARRGCFTGNRAIYVADAGNGAIEVRTMMLAAHAEQAMAPAAVPEVPIGACFSHGQTIAALLAPVTGDHASSWLVGYRASTGEEIYRTKVDGISEADRWDEGRYASNDEDVRFAPLVARDGQGQLRVVMLDLEQGAIAWTGKPFAMNDVRVLYDHGNYELAASTPPVVVALDGATGKVRARTCLPAGARTRAAGGRVWVYDEKQWALLDGATLAKITGDLPLHACPDALGVP